MRDHVGMGRACARAGEEWRARTPRRPLGGWPLLAALALAGCGGGGGSAPDQAQAPGFATFTVQSGDRLVYADEATGVLTIADQLPGGTQRSVTQGGGAPTTNATYMSSASGLTLTPGEGSDDTALAIGPVQLLRLPVQAGDTFVQVDKTVAIDRYHNGIPDTFMMHSVVTVVGIEQVRTPAGVFDAAVHEHTVVDESLAIDFGPANPTHLEIDDWYVAGLGLVRSSTVTTFPGVSSQVVSQASSLVAYRTASSKSVSTAPKVVSTAPASGQVSPGAGLPVTVTFDRPVDGQSLAAGGFTLVDAAGHPIAGSADAVGGTARFTPSTLLASGTYTATVGGTATDLIGNPLGQAFSWTFRIDVAGPTLVSAAPLEDVAAMTPFVVHFSEPLDPASVRVDDSSGLLPTVSVTGPGDARLQFTVSLQGADVTITPVNGWRHATYHVGFTDGVTDVAGNPLPGTGVEVSFQAAAGLFDPPVAAPTPASEGADAIGDVDGDGLPDLLYVQVSGSTNSGQFWRRAGRVDGSLGDPVLAFDASAGGCAPSSLAIVDLDGDGRADVVFTGPGCGLRTLVQDTGGRLVPGETHAAPDARLVRLADLDGDGRPEVVVGGAGSSVDVWTVSAGHLQPLRSVSFGALRSVLDLRAGDVDGDGRIDLVAVSGGQPGENAAVARQLADGSFAPALQLEPPSGVQGVDIGDLDGDGRADLAFVDGFREEVHVLRQRADGSFGPTESLAVSQQPGAVRIADVDGDGRADLLVLGFGHIGLFVQNPDGSLAQEDDYPGANHLGTPDSFALGDIDRDGRLDVAAGNQVVTGHAGVRVPAAARGPGLAGVLLAGPPARR